MNGPKPEAEELERALDSALAKLPRHAAPASLRQRLEAQVAKSPTAAPFASKPRALLAAALTAFALAAALAFWVRGTRESEALVKEAVNDHLRVLYSQHAIEIESGGIHQVKPWFEGRLDFAPVLAFEGDETVQLRGGAVAYFLDRKAAAFIFKLRLHLISVFVFRADDLPWPSHGNARVSNAAAQASQSRGFNVLLFKNGDLGYALVSDVDRAELAKLAPKLIAPK